MNRLFSTWAGLAAGSALLLLGAVPAAAAAMLSQQADPTEAHVGDEITITFTLQNGGSPNLTLPVVDGLHVVGEPAHASNFIFSNGTLTTAEAEIFTVVADRAGDFTIPPFDVTTDSGKVRTQEIKLHVLDAGAGTTAADAQPPGGGPVTDPTPGMATEPTPPEDANAADLSDDNIRAPTDSDGRPAKVFMLILPKTTDAYVGESVPMRIEFFIRMDAIAQQDSLPTIQGSNFLMNDLSVRPDVDNPNVGDESYQRETWVTAIAAPRAGDFPLQMVRDTYWTKNVQGVYADPLGNIFGPRPTLAHGNISSNGLTLHVHPLPEEGRPAGFTGAIGQFQAIGDASPTSVNVGEPVYLNFKISGEGNFDRVRCPTLNGDGPWKTYVPSSRIDYDDESHTQGSKVFQEAIIPRQGGERALPAASFSYFDPAARKYVTLSIDLPALEVTGAAAPETTASTAAPDANPSAAMTPAAPDLLPNRLEFGALHPGLEPAYRHPWFWLSQGVLLAALLIAAPTLLLRARRRGNRAGAERIERERSRQEWERAMSAAVRRGDALAFFAAARQTIQLQGAARWDLRPVEVDLRTIAARDPQLGERLAPLFARADEVMYSANATNESDLAEWERLVREEMLQPGPAPAGSVSTP